MKNRIKLMTGLTITLAIGISSAGNESCLAQNQSQTPTNTNQSDEYLIKQPTVTVSTANWSDKEEQVARLPLAPTVPKADPLPTQPIQQVQQTQQVQSSPTTAQAVPANSPTQPMSGVAVPRNQSRPMLEQLPQQPIQQLPQQTNNLNNHAAHPVNRQALQTVQQAAQQNQIRQTTYTDPSESKVMKKVGFRSKEWKTIHGHDEKAAQTNIATLKKIGCEVTTQQHGDHMDIRFRCADWKTMQLPSVELQTQWSTWLQDKGLETVVFEPPAASKTGLVKYRLTTPRTLHLHESQQSTEVLNTLKMIGANVVEKPHGDHLDATYDCQNWKTMQLENCNSAHVWQTWLQQVGFETQHEH